MSLDNRIVFGWKYNSNVFALGGSRYGTFRIGVWEDQNVSEMQS
jgi:hypothetical protein